MILGEAKILIVDDEPALREILAKWLASVGCGEVRTAVDGVDALEAMERYAADLLISDVRMPQLDGVGLVRRLGELRKTIPSIVFVSGFGDVDEREMYGLGVEAFMAKPLRLEELIAVMKKALAEREALWSTPMETAPRQTMEFAAGGLVVGCDSGSGTAEESALLHIGRGGFSARYPGPLSLGKVSFQCSCPGHEGLVSGQGMVRWRSRADQRVGIEISYLAAPCRRLVLEKLGAAPPHCFIPG
jgi:CheY-like chemotaxis protein